MFLVVHRLVNNIGLVWIWILNTLRGLLRGLRGAGGSSSWSEPEGLDKILSTYDAIQGGIRATVGSSSGPGHQPLPFPLLNEVNEYVYEVRKPTERPSVEIVFFHGLQLENSKEAYITTWVSRDKRELWLNWLVERFPRARILTISYDSFYRTGGSQGRMGMYVTTENLVHCLTGIGAQVGQDGCPVLLVGHCLGGLVMKELCVQANSFLSTNQQDSPDQRLQNFLDNVRGIFFYATPHHGSRLADMNTTFQKGPLLNDASILNTDTARRNEAFRKLRAKYRWKAYGVGESHEVTVGNFKGILVPEASARHDVDEFYTSRADHFNVCRPVSRKSGSFSLLSTLIADVLRKDKERFSTQIGLQAGLVGIEGSVKKLRHKLETTQRLGIVGMGGIGKTTLARAVFDNISGNFEYACFLEEVKQSMVEEEQPARLRAKIIGSLSRSGRKVSDTFDWSTLKGKSVLLVLDDAEFESQVEVMTESDDFSEDSRVIVTSRNKEFLRRQDFEFHEAEELGLDDSKRLFSLKAFKRDVAPENYEGHVTRCVESCGGLPLTLKVLGGYIYSLWVSKRLQASTWDELLKRLSQGKPLNGSSKDGLWNVLRISYDSLAAGSDEQEMFLDIATCFHGEKLKEVQGAWRVCSWGSAELGWQNLMDRCLAEEHNGRVWMHEMNRNLGWSIASRDHRRVFDIQVANGLLNQENAEVKVLKIRSSEPDLKNLETGVLAGLGKLEILWLDCAGLDWVCNFQPSRLVFLKIVCCQLDQSCSQATSLLQQISTIQSIRSIILDRVEAPHLPGFLGRLSHLESLKLSHCATLRAFTAEIGQFQGLRHLTFENCGALKKLPLEVGQLKGLRHLSVSNCSSLTELPESFRQLGALESIRFRRCYSLIIPFSCVREFPALRRLNIEECARIDGWSELRVADKRSWEIKQLQDLKITCTEINLMCAHTDVGVVVWAHTYAPTCTRSVSYCGSLANLPKSFGDRRRLQNLRIQWNGDVQRLDSLWRDLHELKQLFVDGCDFSKLPEGVGQLRLLRLLEISYCKRLEIIPDIFGQLPSLQQLKISDCSCLRYVPQSVGKLQALEQLIIGNCKLLTELPECVVECRALRHLEITDCAQLTALPATLEQLLSLEHLAISSCPLLTKLPDPVGDSALRHLEITDCAHLTALPATLEKLLCLEHLAIRSCPLLTNLPGSVGELRALGHLNIRKCDSLTALPDAIGRLKLLKRLTIHHCPCLTKFPESVGELRALRHLEIHVCDNLAALPDALGQLNVLVYLEICWCESLTALPNSVGDLQVLEHLIIKGLPLTEIPKSVGLLKALQHLQIEGCDSLKALPETLGQLQALKRLLVDECPCLTEIPECVGELQTLLHLDIMGCHNLTALPDTLGQLKVLQLLEVRWCESLTALPNTLGDLQALERLELGDLPLTKIPESIGRLGKLQYLTLNNSCLALKTLPETLGKLQALEKLTFDSLSLMEIPEFLGQLQALQYLELKNWLSLEALPDTLGQLQALERLIIHSCPCLREFPESVGDLRALKVLVVADCPCLTKLPESVERLSRVGALEIIREINERYHSYLAD